uniref:Lipase domain-containing protein n=1 Tax=Rhabditophanes sp. KR3021 TaxID=114890 RepID=A0AC35TGF0_9BILA
MKLLYLVLILCLTTKIHAQLSSHFQRFILDNYDPSLLTQFNRGGKGWSFGGKKDEDDEVRKRPVIIVHGITNKLDRFQKTINALLKKGYNKREVYGTTWGDGGGTPAPLVSLKCQYIKQIRLFIIAVSHYTKSDVDIVAYSMGSPIARKAILGGKCVDVNEDLGPPLTKFISTYISVAGANYGSSLCIYPLPITICNKNNGLYCGSHFIQDINSRQHYEGQNVYSIFSDSDEKVGTHGCGKYLSPIIGGFGYIKKRKMSHDDLMDKTIDIQINLLQRKNVS